MPSNSSVTRSSPHLGGTFLLFEPKSYVKNREKGRTFLLAKQWQVAYHAKIFFEPGLFVSTAQSGDPLHSARGQFSGWRGAVASAGRKRRPTRIPG